MTRQEQADLNKLAERIDERFDAVEERLRSLEDGQLKSRAVLKATGALISFVLIATPTLLAFFNSN